MFHKIKSGIIIKQKIKQLTQFIRPRVQSYVKLYNLFPLYFWYDSQLHEFCRSFFRKAT